MNPTRLQKVLRFLRNYAIFFLTAGFVTTCCMLLFLKNSYEMSGILLSREDIRPAAKYTLFNLLFISLLYTIIDMIRRHQTVRKPVRKIAEAAEKVMQGDLSVHIEHFPSLSQEDGYNTVIDCFNRMVEELAGMETLRTDFIANVSHELKTPLAVMQNYGTMLQQPGLSEETRIAYAKSITDACRSLTNMISNILKLNKLENQQIYPNTRVYNLGEQLCECLLGFEDAWERKDLNIDTDLQEDISVRADPELLSLVFNNLFSNAVKFTEPGGTISLALKTEGDMAVVSVSDTGCGISPETGTHIFEKFYQGDTSHATKGNGLGLALVKRVIDIMGGDISVTSQVGVGSTFTVKLRREKDETDKSAP